MSDLVQHFQGLSNNPIVGVGRRVEERLNHACIVVFGYFAQGLDCIHAGIVGPFVNWLLQPIENDLDFVSDIACAILTPVKNKCQFSCDHETNFHLQGRAIK